MKSSNDKLSDDCSEARSWVKNIYEQIEDRALDHSTSHNGPDIFDEIEVRKEYIFKEAEVHKHYSVEDHLDTYFFWASMADLKVGRYGVVLRSKVGEQSGSRGYRLLCSGRNLENKMFAEPIKFESKDPMFNRTLIYVFDIDGSIKSNKCKFHFRDSWFQRAYATVDFISVKGSYSY